MRKLKDGIKALKPREDKVDNSPTTDRLTAMSRSAQQAELAGDRPAAEFYHDHINREL